jgi:hypothetical protein
MTAGRGSTGEWSVYSPGAYQPPPSACYRIHVPTPECCRAGQCVDFGGNFTRKESKQPISPVLWQRIKINGQKIGLDPQLGTELGRLALHDELTSAEVSAGFRIAGIFNALY